MAMGRAQKGETANTVLLHAVDCIKSILVHLEKTGEEGQHNMQAVIENLKAIIEGNDTPLVPDLTPYAFRRKASLILQGEGEQESTPQRSPESLPNQEGKVGRVSRRKFPSW